MITRIINYITKMKMLRSLRVRIFVIILLVGFIPSVIMRYGIIENYVERAVSLRTSDVQNQMKILANHLISYNYLKDTSSEVINAELNQLSNLYDGRVLIINQDFRIIKDTYSKSEGKIVVSEEIIKCFRGSSMNHYDDQNHFVEIAIPIIDTSVQAEQAAAKEGEIKEKENPQIVGAMLISVSTDSILATIDILTRKALILEISMMLFIIGIAIGLSKILLKPFSRVTEAINEVKEDHNAEAISVPDYLETEHIIEAFNQVLRRMKVIDESRQEFVSNVSHELKTPLTSMKVLADSLLSQEEAPLELYREFMVDIADEIDRENKIVNDLLSLVRMDKKAAALNIESVSINGMVEFILRRLRPIAMQRDIEVTFESMRDVAAEVDEVKMTLILTNLVENAIKYNKEQGWVRVKLNADHQFFSIEVTDSGIGIPEAALENIYERFYRVDKSHSREIGGTGLGLAIARNAVLMHRGSIKATSVENEGATFIVKIPLIYLA